MPRVELAYLVIRADHNLSLRKRRPAQLAYDEVAVQLRFTFPDGWGSVLMPPIEVGIPEMLPFAEVVVPVT